MKANFRKPVYIMTTASLVLSAIIQAESANAQNSAATNTASSGSASAAKNYDKSGIKVGSLMYVTVDKLNLRKANSLGSDAVVGALTLNDQVQIVDALDSSTPLVQIKIIKSSSASNSNNMYVSAGYLSLQKSAKNSDEDSTSSSGTLSKYIVIQNVATEKTRVYERCTSTPNCPHQMVFETDMVVGRPTGGDDTETWLGRFKLTEWIKFYQDEGGSYPSWYDPNYPQIPGPGASLGSWVSKKLLPNGQGDWRGAFGWYAGKVAPNANSQWIHGTFGWGKDGEKFIQATKKGFFAMIKDLRSHGCTRIENRGVAFMRHLISPGTEIVRVYAREGYHDSSLAAYQSQTETKPWEFILTKDGVRQSGGPDSDKEVVSARGLSPDRILETGTYDVDQFPTAQKFVENATKGERRKGRSGNIYDIADEKMRGVFLVDEGKFIDYKHPEGLSVGGFAEKSLPEYLKTSGAYSTP